MLPKLMYVASSQIILTKSCAEGISLRCVSIEKPEIDTLAPKSEGTHADDVRVACFFALGSDGCGTSGRSHGESRQEFLAGTKVSRSRGPELQSRNPERSHAIATPAARCLQHAHLAHEGQLSARDTSTSVSNCVPASRRDQALCA